MQDPDLLKNPSPILDPHKPVPRKHILSPTLQVKTERHSCHDLKHAQERLQCIGVCMAASCQLTQSYTPEKGTCSRLKPKGPTKWDFVGL
jgi:hypothetical protein